MSSNNQSLWLAYSKAVQEAVGVTPNPEQAFFFANKAQKGPLGGEHIPQEYTNYGLFQIGNNLLPPDGLFYIPSNQDSYIRSLKTYLSWVDQGGVDRDGVAARVLMAAKSMDAARTRRNKERDIAFEEYEKLKKMGDIENETFKQWSTLSCPAFMTACRELDQADAVHRSALSEINGPLSDQWTRDMNVLDAAVNGIAEVPGVTMKMIGTTPNNARQMLDLYNSGKPIPAPEGAYLGATFESPDYRYKVGNWMRDPVNGKHGENSAIIDVENGKNVDLHQFGQSHLSGNVDLDARPWFSIGISGSSDREEKVDDALAESGISNIEMTWHEIHAPSITPGRWNIGNPKNTYPNLKAGAPKSVRTLIVPTQFVMIKGLGYKITVKESEKKSMTKTLDDTKKAGGFLRIFGIPIQVGGDYKKIESETSHVSTWNEESGTLEILPTDDGAYASIIAVLGQRVVTA